RIRRAVSVRYLERLRHRNDGGGAPVDRDAANVRTAVGWALSNDPDLVDVDVCTALYRFYETTGRLVEGEQMLCRVAAAGPAPAGAGGGRARAARAAGD